ncbi:MAG TPA: bifunctional UDP-N-acetylglucosamine diphosphorylase/glucosamine-1-phosphate N-acetyltransferase GlmU [Edaphobacter sp.]
MNTPGLSIAIMAAGKGTRLKSKRPKVLHEIGGRALLLHVIAAAREVVPADQIYCIIGHEADRVRAAVEATGVEFVLQPEQRGTGHALQMVKAFFALSGEEVPQNLLVLSGDVPLIRPETIQQIYKAHRRENAAMTILTAIPTDPTGYGRIIRAEPGTQTPDVNAIVEQKSLRPDQLDTQEINSGIYCFRTKALFDKLDLLDTKNAHGEFYLTDIAAMLVADGERVIATRAESVDEVLGANTIAEMMHLDAAMRLATARRLMANGVTIFRPETTVIDAEVEVGADTVIEPYVQLLGATKIGSDCRIRSYSVIQDTVIGDNVTVRNGCIMDTATIADGAILGPYAHLRPESRIGAAAHVGNFVETKKVTLGAGSKANHLNYLGDAVIGAGVNVGAGAITCNYDGARKHQTTIGDNVFVGSDSTLVAPVTIESGSYIAAGSCITDDVPSGSLAFGRARQVVKPGWVAAHEKTLKNGK